MYYTFISSLSTSACPTISNMRLSSFSNQKNNRRNNLLSRATDEETHALNLLDVVESEDADEGVRVVGLALIDFSHNRRGIGGSEHRKLPHSPVAAVIVSRHARVFPEGGAGLVELNTRDETVLDHVVHLGFHIRAGEGVKEGHSLVLNVVLRVDNFLAVSLGDRGAEGRRRGHGTAEGAGHGLGGDSRLKVVAGAHGHGDQSNAKDGVAGNRGNDSGVSLHTCGGSLLAT
mmetsp:Transcript_6339/g.11694  ORF Transcript_6339/g.11694 Transcript_6339/m.11694 type:complete len:231 (-) Transcript_6339:39-731(-)